MNYGFKLTPQVKATLLAAIRSGAFIQDAFRIAGVPDKTWRLWMDSKLTRGVYYTLQNEIKQAQSIAKVIAAQAVKADDPFKWCANGPGRDMPGEPGWAAISNPSEPTSITKVDPLQFPEFLKFVNNVRIVMAHFPEAKKMLDSLNNQPVPLAIE
jgi:hypothetical protein